MSVDRKWLYRAMYKAYLDARKGKTQTEDEYRFEVNAAENVAKLVDEILRWEYKPSRGIAFVIEKPVRREIFAAPFRDRVVHHFLYNQCANWWDDRLIYNSSSCRKGKGTLFGIHQLEKDIRAVSDNYHKKAWVIKLDIQGYFMSLPREALRDRIDWGLKRQYAGQGSNYELMHFLWSRIIFDNPVKNVGIRPPVDAWRLLFECKSLFFQTRGKGIVIGNLSSQLLSNIYLDQLDRFVTRTLGYKHYGRYVDDFYIVVTEEELPRAKKNIKVIEEYLLSLGLTLHPKKRYIQPVTRGVQFLGAVVYPYHTVPSRRFKNSFYQATMKFEMGLCSAETLASYLGYCSQMKGKKLCRKVFELVGWEFKG